MWALFQLLPTLQMEVTVIFMSENPESDFSLSVLPQDPQRKEVLKPLKTLGLGLEVVLRF